MRNTASLDKARGEACFGFAEKAIALAYVYGASPGDAASFLDSFNHLLTLEKVVG
jgi:hypothetical protein